MFAESFVTQASRRPPLKSDESGDKSSDSVNEVSPKKKKDRHVQQSSKQKKRLIPDTNSDEQKLPKKKPATTAKVRAMGGRGLPFIALAGAPQE
jgi:hypothetical protein